MLVKNGDDLFIIKLDEYLVVVVKDDTFGNWNFNVNVAIRINWNMVIKVETCLGVREVVLMAVGVVLALAPALLASIFVVDDDL